MRHKYVINNVRIAKENNSAGMNVRIRNENNSARMDVRI